MIALPLSVTLPAWPASERRALAAWLLCWIVLPNIGFWLLWIIGAPPRHLEIIVTGVTGLVVRRQPYWVKIAAFIATLLFSVVAFIAGLFNLAITSLLASVGFLVEMRPGTSIEYIGCVIGILLTTGLALRLLRAATAFAGTTAVVLAATATMGAAGVDYWMSSGMRGAYGRSAPGDAPFASAVGNSGFGAGADRRHLLLVVVESMGLPIEPAMRARLFARWRQPDVAALYTVTQGDTPYFGSTTSGEMRELCGRWGDYYDLLDRTDAGCLPARLRARGYRTIASHSFDGEFFKRRTWYPNIGFQTRQFGDTLMRDGAHGCPGVFPGACDRDVPAILARELRTARQPQFHYWLTVNTHLPVPTDVALRTRRCVGRDRIVLHDFGMICRQFQLWDQLAESLADQITRAGFPATDILLVGDHMPPYFDRRQRGLFDPAHVPWILLRRKHAGLVAP